MNRNTSPFRQGVQGRSLREIGRTLGRSAATLSRELRRNSLAGEYRSADAQRSCQERRIQARRSSKLDPNGSLWPLAAHLLDWLWSPQQIARKLRRMWPEDTCMHVSHETIYNAIHAHPNGELVACLRQGRSSRRARRSVEDRRGRFRRW